MSIFVGGSEITEIKIGSTVINEVYVGSTLVWTANHKVTQGVGGIGIGNGYSAVSSPTFGSVSPTKLNGADIASILLKTITSKNGNTSYLFSVQLYGNRAQSFFTSVTEPSIYSAGALPTSSATYNYNSSSNLTSWSWGVSSQGDWDGSGVVEVDFQ